MINLSSALHCHSSAAHLSEFLISLLSAGLPPHEEEEEVEERGKEPASDVSARTKTKLIHKVSYDDYLAVWNGIATTRPARDAPNPRKLGVLVVKVISLNVQE